MPAARKGNGRASRFRAVPSAFVSLNPTGRQRALTVPFSRAIHGLPRTLNQVPAPVQAGRVGRFASMVGACAGLTVWTSAASSSWENSGSSGFLYDSNRPGLFPVPHMLCPLYRHSILDVGGGCRVERVRAGRKRSTGRGSSRQCSPGRFVHRNALSNLANANQS